LPSLEAIKNKIKNGQLSNQEYKVYSNLIYFENTPIKDLKLKLDNVLNLLSKELSK